jgi:hypothetical protein
LVFSGRNERSWEGWNWPWTRRRTTLLVVHEALERLAAEDAPKAELVGLRFFTGLTRAEAAKVLRLWGPTVKRYWDISRIWLLREIRVIAAGG